MSRLGLLGLGVVGGGAAFAYLLDNSAGVAFASACLIAGLVLIVASEARGLVSKAAGPKAKSTDGKQARLLVLVKGEVHAYPQGEGKLQEIHDPDQTNLDTDLFLCCWLLLAAELSLRVTDLRLTLKGANGFMTIAERVEGDLKNWHLRKEESISDEESDSIEGNIRTTKVSLAELDAAKPLDCGNPREGWLHFRLRNTTPFKLKQGTLELSVRDSLAQRHTATARVRRVPGSIGPIPATSPSKIDSKKDEPPVVPDKRLAAS